MLEVRVPPAAQAIKKIGELNWKPVHILANVSSSIGPHQDQFDRLQSARAPSDDAI